EGNEEEGQWCMAPPPVRGRPAVAKSPLQGAGGCDQGPNKGRLPARRGHPQGQQPPAGMTGYGQAPCKGRPPVGAVARKQEGHMRVEAPPAANGQPARGCLPAARPQGQHLPAASPQRGDAERGCPLI
ncbi:hypothetical protein GW17_00059172, partial [Ensete ventricosum]